MGSEEVYVITLVYRTIPIKNSVYSQGFHSQKSSKKWVLPPNTNVEHKYSLSIIVTEELRWVHGGKGQVA
jgi:hypothetical protein